MTIRIDKRPDDESGLCHIHRIIELDEFVWKVQTYNDYVEIYTSSDLRKFFASGQVGIPGGW